jgi:hypothetical protein
MSIWGQLQTWVQNSRYTEGDKNAPDAMSPVVRKWQEDLALVRTIYSGWRALFRQSEIYLPQHPKEDAQDYLIRARRPTFYNAFGRTVRALAGAPFSQPSTPEGVPTEIQTLYDDDIDNQGTAGDAFVRHTFQDALTTGLAGIFVGMPVLETAPGREPTRADELDAGLRPYWTMVRMDDICSFRPVVENGAVLLSQLSFKDRIQVPDGDYGVQIVDQVRVLRRLPSCCGKHGSDRKTSG